MSLFNPFHRRRSAGPNPPPPTDTPPLPEPLWRVLETELRLVHRAEPAMPKEATPEKKTRRARDAFRLDPAYFRMRRAATAEAIRELVVAVEDRRRTAGADISRGAVLAEVKATIKNRPSLFNEPACKELFQRIHRFVEVRAEHRVQHSALCLSGGGIRSATFALGVLQALARRGILQDFAYLSTVSGGGYIGAWLSSWIERSGQNFHAVAGELGVPERPTDHAGRQATRVSSAREPQEPFETEPSPIHYLRKYSNYLTPVLGLLSGDGWAVAATVARNLLLNWLLIVPALLGVLLLPRMALTLELQGVDNIYLWQGMLFSGLSFWSGVYALAHLLARRARSEKDVLKHCILPLLLFCGFGTVAWYWGANFQINQEHPRLIALAAQLAHWAAVGPGFARGWMAGGSRLLGRMVHSTNPLLGAHYLGLFGDAAWGVLTVLFAVPGAMWLRKSAGLPKTRNLLARVVALVVVFAMTGAAVGWVGESAADCLVEAGRLKHKEDAIAARNRKDTHRYTPAAKRAWRAAIYRMHDFANAAALASIAATDPTALAGSEPHVVGALPPTAAHSPAAPGVAGKAGEAPAAWALLSRKKEDDTLAQWVAVDHPARTPVQQWFREVFEGPRARTSAEVRLNVAILCVCFGFPILLSLIFVANTVLTGVLSRLMSDEDREWLARASGWAFLFALLSCVLNLLVLHGPDWLVLLWDSSPKLLSAVGGVSALLTILGGRSDKVAASNRDEKQTGSAPWLLDGLVQFAAPIFVAILIMLFSLLTTLLLQEVCQLTPVDPRQHWAVLQQSNLVVLVAALLLLAFIASKSNVWVNINKFSLHAMYRDRLIRAYLGATNRFRNANLFTGFDPDDNIRMAQLRGQRPFHVINTTLNLVGGTDLAWQQRLATSFTFTPLVSGATILGYRDSSRYALGADLELRPTAVVAPPDDWTVRGETGITLGTALAISGAAVSPNHGYNSSPLVAFLLTFFNARLGGWFGNPGPAGAKTWTDEAPQDALKSLVDEAFGLTDAQHPYVNLSDGGHFENLGLYEMVLRRCRLIVVSDAGCDPDYSFEDLGNAVAKIRVDFGIPIVFDPHIDIRKYSPNKAEQGSKGGRHCAVARICYSAVDGWPRGGKEKDRDGWLIYIKPAMCGSEPMDVFHYYREHPTFPHEPTTDQWFTEAQFESYRMLGEHCVDEICGRDAAVEGLEAFVRQARKYTGKGAKRPAWPKRRFWRKWVARIFARLLAACGFR